MIIFAIMGINGAQVGNVLAVHLIRKGLIAPIFKDYNDTYMVEKKGENGVSVDHFRRRSSTNNHVREACGAYHSSQGEGYS
jgi:hypothetical protein